MFDLPDKFARMVQLNWCDTERDSLAKATELPEIEESYSGGGGRGRGGGRGSYGSRGFGSRGRGFKSHSHSSGFMRKSFDRLPQSNFRKTFN